MRVVVSKHWDLVTLCKGHIGTPNEVASSASPAHGDVCSQPVVALETQEGRAAKMRLRGIRAFERHSALTCQQLHVRVGVGGLGFLVQGCPATRPGYINIHVICHSHNDAGWLDTVDVVYSSGESPTGHARSPWCKFSQCAPFSLLNFFFSLGRNAVRVA